MRPLLIFCLLVMVMEAHAAPFNAFDVAHIEQRPGAQIPLDLAFQDETGRTVTLRRLGHGRPLLLVPVQHQCPNICGVTLGGLAGAILSQPYHMDNDFSIVAFGIDPKEGTADSSASLKDVRSRLPELVSAGGLHALTGTAADIAAVMEAIGYRYAWDETLRQYAHIAATAVLTRDGHLSRWIYGIAPDPMDLRLALTEAGEGLIGTWGEQLLLLCYHYDPRTGRYGSLIWLLLRVGGLLTVLVLAGFIVVSVLRERRMPGRSP